MNEYVVILVIEWIGIFLFFEIDLNKSLYSYGVDFIVVLILKM